MFYLSSITQTLTNKSFPLYDLDEATSALDSESELVVQEALDKLLASEKRTTVIIAHRLTTIRNADVIVVLAGGKVVETGTHDALMELGGHYHSLVQKQEHSLESGVDANGNALSKADSEGNNLASMESAGNLMALKSFKDKTQLKFNDVRFAYPTRSNKPILNKFTLSVKQGETLALVGPSGGGKSTTIGLIERFYDPDQGSIEFEGVDIKELNLHWYRDNIGIVSQEPTLFSGTIAKNISYGAPNATQKDIEAAALAANAHDFISSFPKGYDTDVGEGGNQLSGGQVRNNFDIDAEYLDELYVHMICTSHFTNKLNSSCSLETKDCNSSCSCQEPKSSSIG